MRAITTAHIRLVKATTRWQTVNGAVAEPAWRGDAPIIAAFWHERLALTPYCWPTRVPFNMLMSGHPDGQFIAGAVEAFGLRTVVGSSTRGGSGALRALLRKLKDGESVGLTPDGPRGPRREVGDGIIALARLSGVPILPAAVGVSRRIVLKTWDRLVIGLPFGRGAMVWGQPISIAKDADDAEVARLRARLKDELDRITDQADEIARAPA